jgi:hypothetical protein
MNCNIIGAIAYACLHVNHYTTVATSAGMVMLYELRGGPDRLPIGWPCEREEKNMAELNRSSPILISMLIFLMRDVIELYTVYYLGKRTKKSTVSRRYNGWGLAGTLLTLICMPPC